jgi:malonyl-CoA/methylmalonyl-CoA synthetase
MISDSQFLVARREGNHHFIIGRASQDIIKSGGYKISALDIERELLALPYIAEAMVVGVSDEEFGQRVGAVLTLHPEFRDNFGDSGELGLTIDALREDLRSKLAGYKMPTLLRVVEGDLPKTASGKVLKKVLGEKYFPEGYEGIREVQIWRVRPKGGEGRAKL